jgi:hypothetical protein
MNEAPPGLIALLMIVREWGTTLRVAVLLLVTTVPITLSLTLANNAVLGGLSVLLGLVVQRSISSRRTRRTPRSPVQQRNTATDEPVPDHEQHQDTT